LNALQGDKSTLIPNLESKLKRANKKIIYNSGNSIENDMEAG